MNYSQIISFLPADLYEFALNDLDTQEDIISQKLDNDEILDLVYLNYQLSTTALEKKKITMSIANKTLQAVKLQAAKQ
jgi:predicted DNA binding CopG/RHH family protein